MKIAKKPEYYIVKVYNDLPGCKLYLKDHYTNEFVRAYERRRCSTFPKKRAEQIISRLKAQTLPDWKSRVEFFMEEVE